MSIASEITRINNNIASAYSQCQSKGATMPATQNSANLANTISTISGGGGADLNDYFNTTVDLTNPSSSETYYMRMVKRVPTLTIASGVDRLNYLLYNTRMESISFDGIDLTGIKYMTYMLQGNPNLKSVDFANITNTSSLENISRLCTGCSALENVSNMFPLTYNSVSIDYAFQNCYALKQLDLSNWTTKRGSQSWPYTFNNTYKLAVLDISGLEITGNAALQTSMFQNCGRDCLQSDGAYADGIPYIYVKDATAQTKILASRTDWSTNNVVIKS